MEKQKLGPLQQEWVGALRSGDFPQCKGQLFKERRGSEVMGHCCLGVACMVAEASGVKLPEMPVDEGEMPGVVASKLRFRSRDGEIARDNGRQGAYVGGNFYGHLTAMNDAGCRFKTIAKFVEENPGLVFKGEA